MSITKHPSPLKKLTFDNAGWVFALTNPAMPGLVYIGSARGSIDREMDWLNTEGVPEKFNLAYWEWFFDCSHAEACIHAYLAYQRVNVKKNFFRTNKDDLRQAFVSYDEEGWRLREPEFTHFLDGRSRAWHRERVYGLTFIEYPHSLEEVPDI